MKKVTFNRGAKILLSIDAVIAVLVVIAIIMPCGQPWKTAVNQLCYADYKDSDEIWYFEEFSYLDDYENFFYDGIPEKEALRYTAEIAAWEQHILPLFMEDNGVVVFTDNIKRSTIKFLHDPMLAFSLENSTVGYYTERNGYPIIFIQLELYNGDDIVMDLVLGGKNDMTISHEFTHYIDSKYGFSKTTEVISLFEKYGKSYKDHTYTTDGYPGTNAKEFFAVMVSDYDHHSNTEEYMPQEMVDYMNNLFVAHPELFGHG